MSDETTELPKAGTPVGSRVELPPERARVCSSCGAFNVTEREVCRVCAVDLATGEALPWPHPDPDPEIAASYPGERPHPRRWLLAAAAVLVVAGLLLLGMVIAGIGPFADGPSVPDASFASEAYPDDPVDLGLSDIATMTTHPPEGDRTYVAARMVDDTPETAWRSDGFQDQDVSDDPLEIIDLFLAEPAWVDEILIRNGDQRDLAAYEQEGRPRHVRVTFDGGTSYLLNLLDEGRGQQSIELPEPALTTMVRFEVDEVFEGSEDDGVAISDLGLTGWEATDADAELAQERADALPATAPRHVNGTALRRRG